MPLEGGYSALFTDLTKKKLDQILNEKIKNLSELRLFLESGSFEGTDGALTRIRITLHEIINLLSSILDLEMKKEKVELFDTEERLSKIEKELKEIKTKIKRQVDILEVIGNDYMARQHLDKDSVEQSTAEIDNEYTEKETYPESYKKMMDEMYKNRKKERDTEYAEREKLIKTARMLTTDGELLCLIARLEILHCQIKDTDEKIKDGKVSASLADDPYTQKEAYDLEKEIKEKLNLK